jgi:hypothetical protein
LCCSCAAFSWFCDLVRVLTVLDLDEVNVRLENAEIIGSVLSGECGSLLVAAGSAEEVLPVFLNCPIKRKKEKKCSPQQSPELQHKSRSPSKPGSPALLPRKIFKKKREWPQLQSARSASLLFSNLDVLDQDLT